MTNAKYIAVVNPKLLYAHGMQFSLTRMKVHSWSTLQIRLSKTGLNIYTMFGPSDLLCKHYRIENFEIRDLMREENVPDPFYSDINEFRVARIDKISGVELDWDLDVALTPTEEDLQDMEALQTDWDALDQTRRDRLVRDGMILPDPAPRLVQDTPMMAFVFIKLLGVDTDDQLALCRQYLRSALFKQCWQHIRGLFWGFPHAHFQCVVELLIDDLSVLTEFVMKDLQQSFPKGAETATHLVIDHAVSGPLRLFQLFKHLAVKLEAYETRLLDQILADKEEGPYLEFKSSLRWDHNEGRVNKELTRVIAKAISAFMNTAGGLLLIGMDDHGTVLGIEKDIASLGKKQDTDGFRLTLTQAIENYIGAEFVRHTTTTFEERDGKQLCMVKVVKGDEPAFLKNKSGQEKEFYIRTDNSSRPLDMEAGLNYIRMRWPR